MSLMRVILSISFQSGVQLQVKAFDGESNGREKVSSHGEMRVSKLRLSKTNGTPLNFWCVRIVMVVTKSKTFQRKILSRVRNFELRFGWKKLNL